MILKKTWKFVNEMISIKNKSQQNKKLFEDWGQGRNQERANRAIASPSNFCKHDGLHALYTKSYFPRLRYLYVNFFSRQRFRIRLSCVI